MSNWDEERSDLAAMDVFEKPFIQTAAGSKPDYAIFIEMQKPQCEGKELEPGNEWQCLKDGTTRLYLFKSLLDSTKFRNLRSASKGIRIAFANAKPEAGDVVRVERLGLGQSDTRYLVSVLPAESEEVTNWIATRLTEIEAAKAQVKAEVESRNTGAEISTGEPAESEIGVVPAEDEIRIEDIPF